LPALPGSASAKPNPAGHADLRAEIHRKRDQVPFPENTKQISGEKIGDGRNEWEA